MIKPILHHNFKLINYLSFSCLNQLETLQIYFDNQVLNNEQSDVVKNGSQFYAISIY